MHNIYMNQPKEALVIVIAIITFALISSTIGNLTGQASSDIIKRNVAEIDSKESSVSVNPNIISNGEKLTIALYPGTEGIDKIIEIWEDKGSRQEIVDFGKGVNEGDKNRCIVKCTKTTSKIVTIRNYSPGLYYIKAKTVEYDIKGDRRNAVAKAYFTVE